MTMSGMWLLALPSFSSQVRKIAVSPPWYCGLFVIFGMKAFSQLSPVWIEQSWVSLHRFGVTNVYAALTSGVAPSGTSWVWHALRTLVKYAAGLCLTA